MNFKVNDIIYPNYYTNNPSNWFTIISITHEGIELRDNSTGIAFICNNLKEYLKVELSTIKYYEEDGAFTDKDRVIVYPAIYKHFKGNIYATMCESKPSSIENLLSMADKNDIHLSKCGYLLASYTEDLKTEVCIFNIGDKYYHSKDVVDDELIIYRPLYPCDYTTFARNKNMLMSEVDKDKHPKATQKYRFELY